MKSSKKMFILVECILGCLLIGMIIFTVQKRQGQDLKRISVIIQNSDETQWSAFKYGLKMAAQDENVDVFIINPTQFQTAKEEMSAIQHEIDKGADALIIEPVADETLAEQLKKIKVPVVLLSELSAAPENTSKIPVAEPDHYEMGKRLVEELLKDNDGKLKQKKVGIFLSNNRSEAIKKREKGVQDALSETDAKICWVTEAGEDAKLLKQQEKVDYLFALDDRSLVEAGKAVKENEIYGSMIYGIGCSTEAAYYLDTGEAECLLVPDEFNVGYESLVELSHALKKMMYCVHGKVLSYTVLRKENLFSEKNQELLFKMSQ